MTRKPMVLFVALIVVVMITAFTAGVWVGQTTEAMRFTPTPTSVAGDGPMSPLDTQPIINATTVP